MSIPSASSYLYLLSHQQLSLYKVGIGTAGKDKERMLKLLDQGWTSNGLWHHSDKRRTFQWEREIFETLKSSFSAAGADTTGFVGASDRHWHEAISADAISLQELLRLISKVVVKN